MEWYDELLDGCKVKFKSKTAHEYYNFIIDANRQLYLLSYNINGLKQYDWHIEVPNKELFVRRLANDPECLSWYLQNKSDTQAL